MSWYKGYSYRIPISLAGVQAQTGVIFFWVYELEVPDHGPLGTVGDTGGLTSDLFWDTVDSNGRAICVTEADGLTKYKWGWADFDKDNREGILTASRVNNADYDVEYVEVAWLYFGGPSLLATPPVTTGIELTARVDLQVPNTLIVPCVPEQSGATVPSTNFPIVTAGTWGQTRNVFWDVSSILTGRVGPYNRSMRDREVIRFMMLAYDDAGVEVTATVCINFKNTVIVYAGRTYCKTWITGLVDGTNYTLILRVETMAYIGSDSNAEYDFRCSLESINPITPTP